MEREQLLQRQFILPASDMSLQVKRASFPSLPSLPISLHWLQRDLPLRWDPQLMDGQVRSRMTCPVVMKWDSSSRAMWMPTSPACRQGSLGTQHMVGEQVKLVPEWGQHETESRIWDSLQDWVATVTQGVVGWQHWCQRQQHLHLTYESHNALGAKGSWCLVVSFSDTSELLRFGSDSSVLLE